MNWMPYRRGNPCGCGCPSIYGYNFSKLYPWGNREGYPYNSRTHTLRKLVGLP